MSNLRFLNSIFPKSLLSFFPNLHHSFHSPHSVHHQLPIIPNRNIPPFLKLKSRVYSHFLPYSMSKSLSPFHFPRVSLNFKAFIALRPTKIKDFTVIPHKSHPMTRINTTRAKITLLNPHLWL